MTANERMSKVVSASERNWGPGTIHKEGGVTFYKVGRNASSEFFVGQMGKFFLTYSVCISDNSSLEESVHVYSSFEDLAEQAYLGHL